MLFRRFVQLAALAAIAGCGASQGASPAGLASDSKTQAASPSATPVGLPASGPIEPGRYRVPSSAWSVAPYTVTIPEGWQTQYGHVFIKESDQPGELSSDVAGTIGMPLWFGAKIEPR